MANKVLSIEIGTSLTKICILDFKKTNMKVYQTIVFDTPYDCIEDGYIKDKQILADYIKQKLKDAKITIKNVVFTVSSTKIANREVNIPFVKSDKIQSIIEANAADYFPIDIADYKISYSILEKVNTKEEKHYRLLVLAAHNNLLISYYDLAAMLNLHVLSIDYMGNSVYQVLKKQVPAGVHMVVQINETTSLINVLKDGELELQRTIPYGYMSAIDALRSNPYIKLENENQAFQLLRDNQYINSNYGKTEYTLEVEADHSLSNKEQMEEDTKKEITEALRYLISNIIRVSDYYMNKHPENKIQSIYIVGMGSKLRGIEQLLSNELGLEIKVVDRLSCANFMKEILVENFAQSDFIACIGAVMQPVGLIPKQYIERNQKKNNIQVVVIISSLAIVASIILAGLSGLMLKDANNEKQELTKEIAKLGDIDILYSDYIKTKQDLESIQDIDLSCDSNAMLLVDLFAEMEAKLPSNATVHSFRSTDSDILMDFTADSFETAAMVMKQLKTIDLMKEVSTTAINKKQDEHGMTQVSFSVAAKYKNAVSDDQSAEGTNQVTGSTDQEDTSTVQDGTVTDQEETN